MSEVIIDKAHTFLRAHTKGDLRFDEHVRPIKYVMLPDGRVAAPVMLAMLRSVDTVLFIPEWNDEALELQVTLEQFEEHGPGGGATAAAGAGGTAAEGSLSGGAAADRWRIYHGEPEDVRWAFLNMDAARFEGLVIDGEALLRANPLAAAEAAICREINARPDDLRRLCARHGGMSVEEPVMVGVDPAGFDVRARFDIVRIPAPEIMESPNEARRTRERLLAAPQ